MQVLASGGFLYDSSIIEPFPSATSLSKNSRLWPYTMDRGIVQVGAQPPSEGSSCLSQQRCGRAGRATFRTDVARAGRQLAAAAAQGEQLQARAAEADAARRAVTGVLPTAARAELRLDRARRQLHQERALPRPVGDPPLGHACE